LLFLGTGIFLTAGLLAPANTFIVITGFLAMTFQKDFGRD
jgi:hypothetical protein